MKAPHARLLENSRDQCSSQISEKIKKEQHSTDEWKSSKNVKQQSSPRLPSRQHCPCALAARIREFPSLLRHGDALLAGGTSRCAMTVNLPLVIREYVLKMLNEASVGMKALILDDYTVSFERVDNLFIQL